MDISKLSNIFESTIIDYHTIDDYNINIPESKYTDNIEKILNQKCWIDTIQWHVEDEIRNPKLDTTKIFELKKKIDSLNQKRTDLVEEIDIFIFNKYKEIKLKSNYRLNTETPAWAIDRLSILCIKIYHMKEECTRKDIDNDYKQLVENKLFILTCQKKDLIYSIETLLKEIKLGQTKYILYKQMKMYNDIQMNPVLRKSINEDKKN